VSQWSYVTGPGTHGALAVPSGNDRPDRAFDLLRGQASIELDHEGHAPTSVGIPFHDPMRVDDNRLMHQLESTFRLADRFDGKGPPAGRLIGRQAHVKAQPVIDEAQVTTIGQVEFRLQLSETLGLLIIEEAIVGPGRHAGEVEFDSEV